MRVQGATLRQPSSAGPLYNNATEKRQALENDVIRLSNLVKLKDAEIVRQRGAIEKEQKVRHLPRHERV
jgi:hypothetical protein